MFENINIYLNNLYKINSVSLDNIYEKAFLLHKNKKGIYIHSCSLEEIENNPINYLLDLTGNFPIAHIIFYYNDSTSKEEITSFIFKSIKCELNILFILIKLEILNIEKKIY